MVELACGAGHQVVFTGRNEQFIETIARKTGAYGLQADVSVGDDNARTINICTKRMGGVDVLVNNAAYAYRAEIGSLDVDRMKEMFDTNVFGLVDLTNRVVPLMKARGQGDTERAAALYRKLQREYPGTPEAVVSTVPLGRMLLAAGSGRVARRMCPVS